MVTNFFTLAALTNEWQSMLGFRIGDAYSQQRGELTLGLYREEDDDEWSIRIATVGGMPFVFRYAGHNRPRKNVTPLFEDWWHLPITSIEMAHRDRFMKFGFQTGEMLEIMPFGPRANVLILDGERSILQAFRENDELAGQQAPVPVAAPDGPAGPDALYTMIADLKGAVAKRISRALPLVNRIMAAEICYRAGIKEGTSIDEVDFVSLHRHLVSFIGELAAPAPAIYRMDGRPMNFGLVPMQHLRLDLEEERFDSVDDALRTFVRLTRARQAFDNVRDPLIAALEREHRTLSNGLKKMMDELAGPSRADQYEKNGHLLMAHAATISPGAEEARLPDLFEQGGEVVVRLDPERSVVQNAEQFYDRARRTRQARDHAERRLEVRLERRERVAALLDELRGATTVKEVRTLQEVRADLISSVRSSKGASGPARPYRQFESGGYDILVGRSARHNDRLTFDVAGKFDLWLHARGVAGSHVIIRRNRDDQVPSAVINRAARLAAWYSKARGSALVPVIMTERKFVRRAKGGRPGAVIVEREEVYMVEPEAPETETD